MLKSKGVKPHRQWVAVDWVDSPSGHLINVLNRAELTPGDISFLAEAINGTIEQWGDPEGDLDALRRKLLGEALEPA